MVDDESGGKEMRVGEGLQDWLGHSGPLLCREVGLCGDEFEAALRNVTAVHGQPLSLSLSLSIPFSLAVSCNIATVHTCVSVRT